MHGNSNIKLYYKFVFHFYIFLITRQCLLHNLKFSNIAGFNTVCNYNMTIQFSDNELGKILILHSSK